MLHLTNKEASISSPLLSYKGSSRACNDASMSSRIVTCAKPKSPSSPPLQIKIQYGETPNNLVDHWIVAATEASADKVQMKLHVHQPRAQFVLDCVHFKIVSYEFFCK